jgi:predicted nucleic acid-binding protein
MERVALDTTFLIDVQNEHRARGKARGAIAFLQDHQSTELLLPSVALGEYLEGFANPDSDKAKELVSLLRVLPVTRDVARTYAVTARVLRAKGKMIGTNDLWIACTARTENLPLVTRNADDLKRVPGLVVIEYSA